MPYESNVMRRANQALERRRADRQTALEDRRAQIYKELPRVAEIDRLLRRTMVQVISLTLREDEGDPTAAIGAVRARNQALQAERAQLLTGHGYLADVLDDVPFCPKCRDSGWVGARMCDCLRELCTREQIKELSSLLDLGGQSFDLFSLDWYSPLPRGEGEPSARENMEFIYDVCLNYAQKFRSFPVRNLLLYGPPGLGKTFLSACIARTVSENGFSVVYDTAVNVFAQFETQKFGRDEEESREARDGTRRYLGCDLLILDDLGSEMTTTFIQSALYQLVNTRLTSGKHTIISSNLTPDDIYRRYSPQIASRLEGEYHMLRFFGEDIRILKKQRM